MSQHKGFIITLDRTGIEIQKIAPSKTNPYFTPRSSIMHHLSATSHRAYFDLIRDINTHGTGFSYELTFKNEHNEDTYKVTGYHDTTHVTFILVKENTESNEILHEIVGLNNQLITELRALRKQNAKAEDESVYLELSKLNNELLNSKRIIEKQNAELKKLNEQLSELATRDPLTKAYNRRFFYQLFEDKARKATNEHFPICLVMIDFNNFKQVNDTFGHDAGDQLLIEFVAIATEVLSPHKGFIFRMGGDEFVILIRRIDENNTEHILDEICSKYNKLTSIASIAHGIVCVDSVRDLIDKSVESYLQAADRLMYEAKSHMKNLR